MDLSLQLEDVVVGNKNHIYILLKNEVAFEKVYKIFLI